MNVYIKPNPLNRIEQFKKPTTEGGVLQVPDFNPPADYIPESGKDKISLKPAVEPKKTNLVLIMLIAIGLFMVVK